MTQDTYQHQDYYNIDDLLTDEHKIVRDSIRDWVKTKLSPVINDYAQKAEFPKWVVKELGAIGAFGPNLPAEYGCGGMDEITYGIIMQELERCDSGIRSTASVQGSLVMFPINEFGSEEQKKKYLPKLASGDLFGCFGLTEPNHGSNPNGMETKIVDKGDHYILNGSKMWISNSPLADIAIVWAKDEEGIVRGMVVERGMEGFSTPTTHNKWSLRVSITGELVFDNVKIPKENVLPKAKGMRGPLTCLSSARYGIAWGAIGAAMDCFDSALKYQLERKQFGRSIAGFQLQQKKFAEMITEITKAQLMVFRLGQLKNDHKATPQQISMAKRNSCEISINIARESRQMLGAMGITGDFPMMRHAANLESVITYEGTHDIHLLITGMDVTGINSFS